MTFNKAYPYLLVAMALAGLYFQYSVWADSQEGCGCGGTTTTPIGDH